MLNFTLFNSNILYSDILFKIVNIIVLIIYSFTVIFLISKISLLKQKYEQSINHNKNLEFLYDDLKMFRHNLGNIMQSINGYIETNDMTGLKKYYEQMQFDCFNIKNIENLNSMIVNQPAIYSLLTIKYNQAIQNNINVKIHVSFDLNKLNMKIYDFTKILGILLDNAIEACYNCDNKLINLEIREDISPSRQVLLIQNTYNNRNLDIDKISEKGYTSKTADTKSHGLGLWEIKRILKHSKNINLFTTKDSIFFTQQLEIYNN